MGKHVVFLIHGMGQHDKNWSASAKDTLLTAAKQYPLYVSANDFYEFNELRYSDIFDDYIKDYESNAAALKSVIGATTCGLEKAIVDIASTEPDAGNFLVTHFGDVALYGMSDLGHEIRLSIAKQIEMGLKGKDVAGWSIISHSLGTRVIHDVLDLFFDDAQRYGAWGKPRVLMTAGNVIRLMEKQGDEKLWHETDVFPCVSLGSGACSFYLNCNHPLDPFTWLRKFEPAIGWGKGKIFADMDRYISAQIHYDSVTGWNPHDLAHYLEIPAVHANFIEYTMSPSISQNAISPESYQNALERYRVKTVTGGYKKLVDELNKLQYKNFSDWKSVVKLVREYYEIIKKFSEG